MIPMPPDIVKVVPLENYELLLTYETGERRRYDVKPFIFNDKPGHFFDELADVEYFNQVGLCMDGWTVCWPHEQDIDPCELYEEGEVV